MNRTIPAMVALVAMLANALPVEAGGSPIWKPVHPPSKSAKPNGMAGGPMTVPIAFPPGHWKGIGTISGGITGFPHGDAAAGKMDIDGDGSFSFDLNVPADGAVEGTLTFKGSESLISPHVAGTMNFTSDDVKLFGSAAAPNGGGTVLLQGSMQTDIAGGPTVPITFSSPASFALTVTHANCGRVDGDMATQARQAQTAVGYSTTTTGTFVAFRVGKGPSGADTDASVEQFLAVLQTFDKDADQDFADLSNADLKALIQQGDETAAAIAGFSQCGDAPLDHTSYQVFLVQLAFAKKTLASRKGN